MSPVRSPDHQVVEVADAEGLQQCSTAENFIFTVSAKGHG